MGIGKLNSNENTLEVSFCCPGSAYANMLFTMKWYARITLFVLLVAPAMAQTHPDLVKALTNLQVAIEKAKEVPNVQPQFVADTALSQMGRVAGNLAIPLDDPQIADAFREAFRIAASEYPNLALNAQASYFKASQAAYQARLGKRLESPEVRAGSAEQKRAMAARLALTKLPKLLQAFTEEEEAAWMSSVVAWKSYPALGLDKMLMDEDYAKITIADAPGMNPVSFALAKASSLNNKETYAQVADRAYQDALNAGADEKTAKAAAIAAATRYATRARNSPDLYPMDPASRVAKVVTKYTSDPDRVISAAAKANQLSSGSPKDLARIVSDIRRRNGTLELPPIPANNTDLTRLLRSQIYLGEELAILKNDPEALPDPVVAAEIIDHLTDLAAHLGDRSLLSASPWESGAANAPDTLLGWMRSYEYLYQLSLYRLRNNALITEDLISLAEKKLAWQKIALDINSFFTDAITLTQAVDGGFEKLIDDIKGLEANPDLGRLSKIYERSLQVESLVSPWNALNNSLDTSIDTAANLLIETRSEEPKAAPLNAQDAVDNSKRIAKFLYKDVPKYGEEMKKLHEYSGRLRLLMRNNGGVTTPENLKILRDFSASRKRLEAFRKGPLAGTFSLVNGALKSWAKAERHILVNYRNTLRDVAATEWKQIADQAEASIRTKSRSTKVAALQQQVVANKSLLQLLLRQKTNRSHDSPVCPPPPVPKDLDFSKSPDGKTYSIGKALSIFNTHVAMNAANIIDLTPDLIVREPANPDERFHRVIASSDFQKSSESWTLSGDGISPRHPEHRHDGPDLKNGHINGREPEVRAPKGALDLVIVFDTTGSMKDSIQSLKDASKKLTASVKSQIKDVRLGLVEFKDLQKDKATGLRMTPLSADLASVFRTIDTWKPTGGGSDFEETQLDAIAAAVLQSKWRDKTAGGIPVSRAIIVISDAPSKAITLVPDYSVDDLVTTCKTRGNIRIYSIVPGSNAAALGLARTLTGRTGGRHINILDHAQAAREMTDAIIEASETGQPRYYHAPKKFLGGHPDAYSYLLAYDLRQTSTTQQFDAPDVIISSPTHELGFKNHRRPGTRWTSFRVPLEYPAGWVHNETGIPATEQQIRETLANITSLKIRAEFGKGDDQTFLDNVVLIGEPRRDIARKVEDARKFLNFWSRTLNEEGARISHIYGSTDILKARLKAKGIKDPDTVILALKLEESLNYFCNPHGSANTYYNRLYSRTASHIERAKKAYALKGGDENDLNQRISALTRSHEKWLAATKGYRETLENHLNRMINLAVAYDTSLRTSGRKQSFLDARKQFNSRQRADWEKVHILTKDSALYTPR